MIILSLFKFPNLKLGHNCSEFIYNFKIWILKGWPWVVYAPMFFQVHERDEKLGFLNSLGRTSKFLPFH